MLLAERPKTIGILREEHLCMMRRWRDPELDLATRVSQAQDLRRTVKEAGHDIAGDRARDEAQGIIDYWASAISSLPGQRYPAILTLDPYLGDAAKLAGTASKEEFASLTGEEQRVAKALFEELLLVDADGTIQKAQPRTRAMLQQRIQSDELDAIAERFVGSGALALLRGDTRETDRFEATDPGIAQDWPDLRDWLRDIAKYHENRRHLMAQAERWRVLNEDRMLLARASQMEQIDLFAKQSDLLDRYIKASKDAHARMKTMRIVTATITAMLLIGTILVTIWLVQASFTIADLERQDEAKREVAKAAQDFDSEIPEIADREQASGAAPGRTGFIWLGSNRRPQVVLADGRDPEQLDTGDEEGISYRLLIDMNLRDAFPKDDYDYREVGRSGTVSAGTLIVTRGEVRGYDRSAGEQYWAKVRAVPRVYIQYANGSKDQVAQLRRFLAESGFDVPEAEEIDSAEGLREVRFSTGQDKRDADLLVDAVERSRINALADVGCQSLVSAQRSGKTFVLELWVDFSATSPRNQRRDC